MTRASRAEPLDRPHGTMSYEAMIFWVALAVSVVLTLITRRSKLLPGEVAVMQWTDQNLAGSLWVAGPVLDTAFTGLNPPIIFVLLVAAVWWSWGTYPATMFAVAGSVTGLTKLADLARRPRPNGDLTWGEIVVGEGGYPSGHVVYTVMVFGMLAYLAPRHVEQPARRWLIRGGALLLIVVTGPSRLIEGDHWPADVVAGYGIAIAGLAGVIWIERRLPVLLRDRPRARQWLQLDA